MPFPLSSGDRFVLIPVELYYKKSFVFFFVCVILGFELKALHLLGRHFTTGAIPPALFTYKASFFFFFALSQPGL
jgi:hypothetical protein